MRCGGRGERGPPRPSPSTKGGSGEAPSPRGLGEGVFLFVFFLGGGLLSPLLQAGLGRAQHPGAGLSRGHDVGLGVRLLHRRREAAGEEGGVAARPAGPPPPSSPPVQLLPLPVAADVGVSGLEGGQEAGVHRQRRGPQRHPARGRGAELGTGLAQPRSRSPPTAPASFWVPGGGFVRIPACGGTLLAPAPARR